MFAKFNFAKNTLTEILVIFLPNKLTSVYGKIWSAIQLCNAE
jgi:hypothetical protein